MPATAKGVFALAAGALRKALWDRKAKETMALLVSGRAPEWSP
jgi:hypothetical protein